MRLLLDAGALPDAEPLSLPDAAEQAELRAAFDGGDDLQAALRLPAHTRDAPDEHLMNMPVEGVPPGAEPGAFEDFSARFLILLDIIGKRVHSYSSI